MIKCFITGKNRPDTPEEKVRQVFAIQLHQKYGYPKENIAIEFKIQRGAAKKSGEGIDVAVFHSKSKTQNNLYLAVETKAPSVTKPDNQLLSYVTATTAEWAVWTNGKKEKYYKTNIGTSNVNKFEEIYGIPHYKQKLGAAGSTGRCNIICSNSILKGGVYGTNGTPWAFCFAEGRTVAKMEGRAILKRHWSSVRETCRIGSRRTFNKWWNCSYSSSTFAQGAYAE